MVASSECKGEWRVAEATRRDETGDVDEMNRRDEGVVWEVVGGSNKEKLEVYEIELKRHVWP